MGESFAEIFFGNCVAIGVPCVTATPEDVKQLQETLQANPQTTMSLDLDSMQVKCGDLTVAVNMNEGSRQMFRSGKWDSCGQLIANVEQVRATATQLPYIDWAKQAS